MPDGLSRERPDDAAQHAARDPAGQGVVELHLQIGTAPGLGETPGGVGLEASIALSSISSFSMYSVHLTTDLSFFGPTSTVTSKMEPRPWVCEVLGSKPVTPPIRYSGTF